MVQLLDINFKDLIHKRKAIALPALSGQGIVCKDDPQLGQLLQLITLITTSVVSWDCKGTEFHKPYGR